MRPGVGGGLQGTAPGRATLRGNVVGRVPSRLKSSGGGRTRGVSHKGSVGILRGIPGLRDQRPRAVRCHTL